MRLLPAALVLLVATSMAVDMHDDQGLATINDDAPHAHHHVRLHHVPHDDGIVDTLHDHHKSLGSQRASGSILLHNYKNTSVLLLQPAEPLHPCCHVADNLKEKWVLAALLSDFLWCSTQGPPISGCHHLSAAQVCPTMHHWWSSSHSQGVMANRML